MSKRKPRIARVTIELTEVELRGLWFIADSFSCHQAEGLGTGDANDDAAAREAGRWISRLRRLANERLGKRRPGPCGTGNHHPKCIGSAAVGPDGCTCHEGWRID